LTHVRKTIINHSFDRSRRICISPIEEEEKKERTLSRSIKIS